MMSAAGGGGLDVSEVFSTYLYRGSSGSKTINNGIDLSTEGGLVWLKKRTDTGHHQLLDTERGANAVRSSSQSGGDDTGISYWNFSFNTNGFGFNTTDSNINSNQEDYCSWTFRKHPKFFDVQTFTTTYNDDPNVISHDLESELGAAFFFQTGSTGQGSNWIVWHRSLGTNKYLKLNQTSGETNDTNSIEEVDNSAHTISFGYPMSTPDDRLVSGSTETTNWVGYFFAHNNGDGEFGPSGDQDIIKCGQYTGNHSTLPHKVTVGFEPQWVLVKKKNGTSNWAIWDVARGMMASNNSHALEPNTNTAEASTGNIIVYPVADGFEFDDASDFANFNNNTYIYIAIRKGPMAVPTSVSDVFKANKSKENYTSNTDRHSFNSGFPVDSFFYKGSLTTTAGNEWYDRKRPARLFTDDTTTEDTTDRSDFFDKMEGVYEYGGSTNTNNICWMWRSAPKFYDVQCYHGNGTAGRTVKHSLEAVPEMIWIKSRSKNGENWGVYHKDLGNAKSLRLDGTFSAGNDIYSWNQTTPTATEFTLGNYDRVNNVSHTYVAYLFATLSGISKVGSYTGNGGTQTIDCGFSNGTQFVFLKKSSDSGGWFAFDTERGIVSGNDPYVLIHSSVAGESGYDIIDPHSSGFILNNVGAGTNDNGATYIFYAIASP